MIPEIENMKALHDMLMSFIFWVLLVFAGFVGYAIGHDDANDFWLGKGEYKCELI